MFRTDACLQAPVHVFRNSIRRFHVKKTILLIAGVFFIAIALASCAGQIGPEGPLGPAGPAAEVPGVFGAEYVGTAACGECHTDTYDVFMQSGHPYKLNPVVDGQPSEYPFTVVDQLPEGYTRDDISYVIGGYNWKYRFVDNEGFIESMQDPESRHPSQTACQLQT